MRSIEVPFSDSLDASAALGISDRVGTIEPGKLADLVLLNGDPVSDIEALSAVDLVMKEGRIVTVVYMVLPLYSRHLWP